MTRTTRIRLTMAAVGLALVGGMLLWPMAAEAGSRYAKPQAPCDKVGEQRKARNGETYECRLKPGADCPRWSWVYRPGPTGSWSSRPGAPCRKCSASPSPSASASTQPSTSASVKPSSSSAAPQGSTRTTPGGEDDNNHPGTLPVTGESENVAALLAILGTALVLFGGTILVIVNPWRRESD